MRVQQVLAAGVIALAVVQAQSKAASLSAVGTDYNIQTQPGGTFFPGGSAPYQVVKWRNNEIAKPLDLDADNVYGTDGYLMIATQFNFPNAGCCGSSVPFASATYPNLASLPSYVTSTQNLTTNKVGGWNYALADDPVYVNGTVDPSWYTSVAPTAPSNQEPYVKIGIVDGNDIYGNDPKIAAGGAGRWRFQVGPGVPSQFRVGVMTDGLDGTNWAATEVLLAQVTGGPGLTIVGSAVTTGALVRNRFIDMHFFDIVGAQPGDEFAIFAKASSDGNGAISAISFDTVPEPAGLAIAVIAMFGASVFRRR